MPEAVSGPESQGQSVAVITPVAFCVPLGKDARVQRKACPATHYKEKGPEERPQGPTSRASGLPV